MVSILNLLTKLKNLLENKEDLENVKFILNFNNSFVPKPFLEPTVVIGVKSINIKNGPFNGYIGTHENKEYFGSEGNFHLSFNIYVPNKIGSKENFSIFQKMYKALFFNEENISVLSFLAKEIKFDPDVGAFLLECEVSIFSLILFEENN